MGAREPRALVLDAGALIAIERGEQRLWRLCQEVDELHVPAGVLAQVWRDPRRQVRVARTLAAAETTVHPLDADAARAAGMLCARSGTNDVVGASVATVARLVGGVVATGDPDDLRRLDPGLRLLTV